MSLPNLSDHHSVHVELRFDGTAPTGQVRLAGGEPRAFSGWVGLVCTVEELVTENREDEAREACGSVGQRDDAPGATSPVS
jgi:hypothetical protein